MTEPRTFAGVFLALLALTGGLALAPTGQPAAADRPAYETTVDGVRYTVHPSELEQGCLSGRDCIPSIDDPTFQSAASADWLGDDDLVIGLVVDGEARAYPLRIMRSHEVVNDEIAGRPVAVTYCPLCRSGLVFDRRVDGRTLTFGVSGKLLDANLVLYDRQTETYWSQIGAEAIVGPMVPATLEQVPSTVTTWGEWRGAHPDTRVLAAENSPAATRGGDRYRAYRESDRVGFGVGEVDDRLPKKAVVYGVTAGGASTAYPEEVVVERSPVHDEVGGVPVLVVRNPADGSVRAFVRASADRTYRVANGSLVDDTGTRWTFEGEAVAGPREGERLERLDTHGFYWFAWSSFHPETAVYRPAG